MRIGEREYRSLWFKEGKLFLIDQRRLPFEFSIFQAVSVDDVVFAIKDMVVRGAPAIGAAAAYGIVLSDRGNLDRSIEKLRGTRPTANDLFHALDYMKREIELGEKPLKAAERYTENIIERCRKIGEYGNGLIPPESRILTHCNAGALAAIDYGTALSPLRIAKRDGKKIFVYVDETRPRLQGLLTSWELEQEGIEHVVIADNAAGYFMERGEIDLVIVGADRITRNGDVANKIGTYEKAVLAKENDVPFYVAAPLTTFDLSIESGEDIPIEERNSEELKLRGNCRIMPDWIKTKNPAFDITPHRYVTAYITDVGILKPQDIRSLKVEE